MWTSCKRDQNNETSGKQYNNAHQKKETNKEQAWKLLHILRIGASGYPVSKEEDGEGANIEN